jgi:hypothetical protein
MKPTQEQIVGAVSRWHVLKYFPSGEHAQAEIMRVLERLVGTVEQLNWLVRTVIDHVGEWPGTKELRGIFCHTFKPHDGVEGYSSIPGFTPEDSESQCSASRREYTVLDTPKRTQKMLPMADLEAPFDRMGEPTPVLKPVRPMEELYKDFKPKPTSIPATPKRSPEERAQEVERLERAMKERQAARAAAEDKTGKA